MSVAAPGETIVVKCGGTITEEPDLLCADLAEVVADGVRVVLVHGGSSDIDALCRCLGIERRRIRGPGGISGRYTDPATLGAVTLALAGAVKPRLVTSLMGAGVRAIGLTGLDLGIVRADRKRPFRAEVDGNPVIVRDDHSGRISRVSGGPLIDMIDSGMVPVLSPPALAGDDDEIVNVDADRVAVAVAIALDADQLIMLSGVEGVRSDPVDPESVLSVCEVPAEGALPFTGGGMGAKLATARDALAHRIPVRLADGRTATPLSDALAGRGTQIVLAAS